MIVLLLSAAIAQDAPWDDRLRGPSVDLDTPDRSFGTEGVDIGPMGGSTGFSVSQASVAGSDGGTHAWTARAQVPVDDLQITVGVPFTSYGTPDTRDAGLGNLAIDLAWADGADPDWAVGLAGHVPLGSTYTWVNDAEELWSSVGIDAYYLRRFGTGATTGAVRTAVGIHAPAGYSPYPPVYAKVDLAGLVQSELTDEVALVGEASFSFWDVSPFDVTGLLQVTPTDGLRLRGGMTLPLASWVGFQPAPVPAGAREITLRLQVQAAY